MFGSINLDVNSLLAAGGLVMEEVYSYQRMREDLARLCEQFPFLYVESIGKSVAGREIPVIRMGTGPIEIHYNAAMHANEWITAPLLMRFLEEAACAYMQGSCYRGKDMQQIFSETSLWVVPMVNPDGVELVYTDPYDFQNWKANLRGVDLNDQYPAHWEEERARRTVLVPGESDYGGEAPLTEPEAVALASFTCLHDFQLVIALHTQGREIYWNYRDLEPPGSEAIADRFAQVSGYKAVKLTDSDAGYKDWFIQEFGRPGFTVEVGLGTNPLPHNLLPQLYEEVADILLEGLTVFMNSFGPPSYTD
jgi:g-D-glutamyl-meso-diaminopimelate peptidase